MKILLRKGKSNESDVGQNIAALGFGAMKSELRLAAICPVRKKLF
jgi:hypothetical protein